MTREKLLERLRALEFSGDEEQGHYDADRALLAYINDPEIEAVYDAISKWYA